MTEINEKTKYFTQRKISFSGNPGKWEKICFGHEDLNRAIICAEKCKAICLGTYTRPEDNPIKEAMDADIRASYLAIVAAGGKMELCLSRFTVTREVIEEFGIITREKVQPKKEAS